MDAILGDYGRCVPEARDAEVLTVTTAMVNKFDHLMNDAVLPLLGAVFEPTLEMINKDFTEYPEHRISFFRLISAIAQHCFGSLLRLPATQLRLIVDSILWAIKHSHRDIADLGLHTLLVILQQMPAASRSDQAFVSTFYSNHFCAILQDIFYVLTDSDHKSAFPYQAAVLAEQFKQISAGQVHVAIYPENYRGSANGGSGSVLTGNVEEDNRLFLQQHMMTLLSNAFSHLQNTQIETFVRGLFDLNADAVVFRAHLRDFLIALREFSGSAEDEADLYAEERELELERKKKAEMEAALRIPGLVKPGDLDDLSD